MFDSALNSKAKERESHPKITICPNTGRMFLIKARRSLRMAKYPKIEGTNLPKGDVERKKKEHSSLDEWAPARDRSSLLPCQPTPRISVADTLVVPPRGRLHLRLCLAQACDVLCCALFMMLYAKFLRDIASFEDRADKENVTPADYAVEVRGIPEDSKEEVRATSRRQ